MNAEVTARLRELHTTIEAGKLCTTTQQQRLLAIQPTLGRLTGDDDCCAHITLGSIINLRHFTNIAIPLWQCVAPCSKHLQCYLAPVSI